MSLVKITFGTIAACALAVAATLNAQAEDFLPILDVPLRDAAITRADDGTYYLTGTANAAMSGPESYLAKVSKHPDTDFDNNDGIWMWKSPDLKNWEKIGSSANCVLMSSFIEGMRGYGPAVPERSTPLKEESGITRFARPPALIPFLP